MHNSVQSDGLALNVSYLMKLKCKMPNWSITPVEHQGLHEATSSNLGKVLRLTVYLAICFANLQLAKCMVILIRGFPQVCPCFQASNRLLFNSGQWAFLTVRKRYKPMNKPQYRRAKQTCEHFQISISTLWMWAKNRKGFPKPFKAGERVTLFDIAAIDTFLKTQGGIQK